MGGLPLSARSTVPAMWRLGVSCVGAALKPSSSTHPLKEIALRCTVLGHPPPAAAPYHSKEATNRGYSSASVPDDMVDSMLQYARKELKASAGSS